MSEYNVCGVLVMARPEKTPEVARALEALPGVEVHARGEDGKLVVTVEGPFGRECADTVTRLALVDGVVSTSLVYHEIDVADAEDSARTPRVPEPQQELAQ